MGWPKNNNNNNNELTKIENAHAIFQRNDYANSTKFMIAGGPHG